MEIMYLLLLLFAAFCFTSFLYQMFDGLPRLGKVAMSWGRLALRQSARVVADITHASPAQPQA